MNLKTKLLFSFLIIGSLLLVNCQVEDLQESASKRNPYAPIVSKEFKEFEKLPGLLSEIIPNHGLSVRNKNTDPRYQFEIDSTAVIQITNNGIAYYTMSITRENQEDGVFENLVVFDNGNEKKAIIVKYKPDASFLSRFELNPDAQFSGKFNMTELGHSNLASRLTSATKCFISTHLYCTNNNPPTLAGKGCYTNKDGGAHVKSITSVNCFEIIINEPEPYLNNTFVLNPINDAGGGNPDIATSIATHPVFMGIIDFRFIRRLTPEQKAWWNNANNNAAVAVILNYLKDNTSNHSYVNNQLILDGDINSEAKAFAKELIDLAITETNQLDANKLLQLTLLIETNENGFFTEEFTESLLPYLDIDQSRPPLDFPITHLTLKTYLNYNKLRTLNPEWSRAKCIWYATKEIVHISLDAFGLIPVGGEIADLVNGVLYTIEGDGLNASLSYASAVPFAGWASTSVKYGFKIVNQTSDINTKVKLVWKVMPDNMIYFGSDSNCRKQLRKILGLSLGNPNQAHHIIPLNLQLNKAIQKAAKSSNAFHMNEALNGITLERAIHNGSHANYDRLIKGYLDAIPASATPDQAYNAVNALINKIRLAIQNNPEVPINQLNF